MYTAKIPKPLWLRDFAFCTKAINLLFHCSVFPSVNPAKRFAGGSEEKVRPAYEKALRPFHRLRAFSKLVDSDPSNPNPSLEEGPGEGLTW